jgi:hypothetical protein
VRNRGHCCPPVEFIFTALSILAEALRCVDKAGLDPFLTFGAAPALLRQINRWHSMVYGVFHSLCMRNERALLVCKVSVACMQLCVKRLGTGFFSLRAPMKAEPLFLCAAGQWGYFSLSPRPANKIVRVGSPRMCMYT